MFKHLRVEDFEELPIRSLDLPQDYSAGGAHPALRRGFDEADE